MFKLFRWLAGIVFFGVILYVVFIAQFGEKALYEHIISISKTEEAQLLEAEIKKKASKTVKTLSAELKVKAVEFTKDGEKSDDETQADSRDADAGTTEHTKAERDALHTLLRDRLKSGDEDRGALRQLVRDKLSKLDK